MNATNLRKVLPTTLWRHILWHHRLMTSIGAYRQQTTVANPRFPGGGITPRGMSNADGVLTYYLAYFLPKTENKKTIGLRGIRHWTLQVYKASLHCEVPDFSLWLLDLLLSDIDWRISQVLLSTWEHTVHEVSNQNYHDDTVCPKRPLTDLWLIFDWSLSDLWLICDWSVIDLWLISDWFWIDCLEARFHFNLGSKMVSLNASPYKG